MTNLQATIAGDRPHRPWPGGLTKKGGAPPGTPPSKNHHHSRHHQQKEPTKCGPCSQAAPKCPRRVRSPYRNVALVKLTPEYVASGELPKMLVCPRPRRRGHRAPRASLCRQDRPGGATSTHADGPRPRPPTATEGTCDEAPPSLTVAVDLRGGAAIDGRPRQSRLLPRVRPRARRRRTGHQGVRRVP